MATLLEACQCAVVQAPVSILEVLRSAPRLNDQNTNPRLNGVLLSPGYGFDQFLGGVADRVPLPPSLPFFYRMR